MDKQKVRKLVEEYARIVVSNMKVNKIILYGSYARGDARKEVILMWQSSYLEAVYAK